MVATTLRAGEIAFTAYQSDTTGGLGGKGFQFVLLKSIKAGTAIYFTDGGYRTDSSSFDTDETMLRWVAQSDLAAGTKISFSGSPASTAQWSGINPVTGAVLPNASIDLGTAGDQITALINPVFGGANLLTGTAIAQINFSAGGFLGSNTAGNDTDTALAPGLLAGDPTNSTAVNFGDVDNGIYNGAAAGAVNSGLIRTIANSINGSARWQTANDPIGGNVTAATFTPAEPNLAVGDIAVGGYNTGNTLAGATTVDSLQIVALKPITAGTVIFITDRTWNGTAFAAAGGGDGTITHTFASNVAAGSIVTIPLSGGVDLEQASDALYIYQGNSADVPTSFLFALELGDGNSTFNGSLLNTGLSNGAGAVSVSYDSAVYNGPTTEAYAHLHNQESLFLNMSDSTNWNGDNHGGQNALDQTDHSGPYHLASDVNLWLAALAGGDGIVSFGVDPSAGGTTGHNLTIRYTLDNGDLVDTLVAPRDISFDTVEGKFFILDSNSGGGTNRILQGNISDLHGNPQAPVPVTVLYTSNQVASGEAQMRDMQIDITNNIIYFTHGQRLEKIVYNTTNQNSTVLATFGGNAGVGNPNGNSNNFIDDFVINFATGTAYLTSHRVISGQEGDTVTKNYIYKVSNLSGSATFANGQISVLPFSPDDQASVPFPGAGAPGEAFPQEEGTLEGIALSPDGNTLIFSTAKVLYDHDGDSGVAGGSGTPPQLIQGGIFTYALNSNPNGNYLQIFGQTDDGDTNSQTITAAGPQGLLDDVEVDPVTGHIYFLDQTGDQLIIGGISQNPPGDEGVWRINANGTGLTFIQAIHNINSLGANSIHINRAPTLTGTGLVAAVTEASSALNSGETTRPLLFGSISIADADTTDGTDEIAHAVVRISNFFTGDLLRISGNTNGTTASGITYAYNAATGAMTLTGAATASEYASALALVTYSYTGDNPTNFGTQPTRTIFASVGDGLNHSDEISVTVNVTGINDTPTTVAGNTVTLAEDSANTPLPGTVGVDATRIKVSDVDADPATQDISVQFSVTFGTLTLDTTIVGGIAASNVTSAGGGELTVVATQNQINITLAANGLKYTPDANFNGQDTLVIITNDRGLNGNDPGTSGTGTTEQNQVQKTIVVTEVNDAPTVANGTSETLTAILEDVPHTAANALTVTQVFGGHFSDAIDIQASPDNATGTTGDAFAGVAIISGIDAARGNWQYFDGTNWQNIGAGTATSGRTLSATTQIRFNPALNYDGDATPLVAHLIEAGGGAITNNGTITLNSGPFVPGGTSVVSTGTVTVNQDITPVNDAPVIANLTGDMQSHFEGDPARLLDIVPTAVAVTDIDSADFDGGSLTATISGGDAAEDVLGVSDGNLITTDAVAVGGKVRYNGIEIGTYSSDGKNGAPLTIDFGTASKTAVQALIGRLTYLNTDNDDPTTGARSIDVVLNDGDGNANGGDPTGGATAIVTMMAINDVTVVGGSTAARAFSEGVNGAAAAILANDTVTLADVDDDTLTNVKISIVTNYASNEDRLAFVNNDATAFGDIVGSFDIPTGVLTLTSPGGAASLAQFEAAVRAATYDNLSQEPSTATRTVRIVADDPPAGVSNNFGFTITVTANNDSPSGTSSTQPLVEDTAVQIKEGLLGFSDVDGDAFAGVRLTGAPLGGKIYFDNGSGPVEVTLFDGSVTYAKVDLDAGKLTFVPTEHLAGPAAASFQFVVVDNGGTAGTGQNADVATRTVTFDISPVNDEPAGSDENSATVVDDQIHTFTVADFQTGLIDVEGNLLSGVQLVALPSSSDGIIYYDPDGAAPAAAISANDSFTVADLMQGRLTFDPAATGSNKAVTFTFKAIDNGSPPATDQTPNTFTLNVTPANQPPTLDLDRNTAAFDYTAAYTENDAAGVAIGDAVAIGDTDAGDMIESMVVTITDPRTGDAIAFGDTTGFTVTPSGTVGTQLVYTVTGSGTAAQYQAILASARYSSSSDNPTAGGTDTARSITVKVNDGALDSVVRTATVNITATPDKPVGLDNTFSVDEDSFRGLGSGSFSFSDPDGDEFLSVTITDVTGGALFYDADGGDHANAVEVTAASSTYTLADFGNGDKLLFKPTLNSNAPGSLSFTLKDDSGAANGADTSDAKTLTFNVTAVNDAPVVDLDGDTSGVDFSTTFAENGSSIPIGNNLSISDVDPGDMIESMTVTLTDPRTGDLLIRGSLPAGFTPSTSSANGQVAITITGTGTGAQYTSFLNSFRYQSESDDPTFRGADAARTITVSVSDGTVSSAVATTTVTITPAADRPLGTADSIDILEDSTYGIKADDFGFSDADGDAFKSVTISNVTGGQLFYDADGDDNSDAVLVSTLPATFTVAELGTGDRLLFRPALNSNNPGSLDFTVTDDSGATGSDTSVTQTLTFVIDAVNDHPNLQLSATGPSQTLDYTENDGAVAIAPGAVLTDVDSLDFENGSLTVSLGMTGKDGDELGILDVGGITVSNGEVRYNGDLIGTVTSAGGANGGDVAVALGDGSIREAVDKLIEAISFRNTSEHPSTALRTVTYTVKDGDGDQDTGTAAAVINVARANDAPVAGAETTLTQIVEDTTDPAGETVANLFGSQFSDVDSDTLAGVAITVNGSGAAGQWQYLHEGLWRDVGEVSEEAALVLASDAKLRFLPAANFNGAAPTLSAHLIDSSGGAVATDTTRDVSANGGTTAISDTPTVLKHSVTAFNDTPSVSDGDPVTAAEQTFVVVNAATTIADVDLDPLNGGAGDYTGAALSLSRASGPNTEDAFKIENGAGFTVSGDKLLDANGDEFATVSLTSPGQIVVSFTSLEAIATTALVNAVARAVQYRNLSDAPPATVEIVTVLLDGSPANGQGPNNSFVDAIGLGGTVITITPVNDNPSIDLDGAGSADTATVAYTENDGLVAIAPDATISDPDLPANYDGGTLTVSFANGAQVDDLLGLGSSMSFSADETGLYYTQNGIDPDSGDPISTNVYFASYGGGDVSSPLTISFNANATPVLVRDVARSIGFVNFSENPVAGTRTISYVLTDGDGGTSATVNATVTLTAVDDNPTLNDDSLFTPENMVLTGDLFADNGNGNDFDPDGPPFEITHVNGQALVGGTISLDLASGAKVTVNSNGTFSYNPNGKFVTLTDSSSGAVNISAPDSFDYTITGGDTATANVTVQGVAGPGDVLAGDSEDNVITGTPQGDVFLLQQGGDDKAYGLGSSDLFVFRAAMTSADEVDGGEAVDQISLQGDYATVPLTLGTKVVNVEFLLLNPGNDTRRGDPGTNFYSYNITTSNENVAPGVQMRIDAARLRVGENFTFNGSAETDGGTFRIYGGEGVDNLTGGSGSDVILFGNGAFGASDIVNGGAGAARDQLALRGDYTLTFGSAQVVSIESLLLQSGRDARDNTDYQYDITMVDANVVGGSITIDAGQLRAAETLKFNGSAEDDATFRIFGGDGNDELTGGQLGDIITGGLGSDSMYGEGGNDRFVFRTTADSNGAAGRDAIQDFASGDLIELFRIDANKNTGADDAFTFIGTAAFSNKAGELRVADQGGAIWLVQGDTDGIGGSDFEFFIVSPVQPTQGDFVL